MAMTLSRWLVLLGVGCALVWFGILGPHNANTPGSVPDDVPAVAYQRRASGRVVTDAQLAQVNSRWRLLELRDSIVARERATDAAGLTVEIDSRIPADKGRVLDSLVRRQWRSLEIRPRVPVVVAVVMDSAQSPHGLPGATSRGRLPVDAFIPAPETRGRCVSLLRVDGPPSDSSSWVGRVIKANFSAPQTINALVSPCAFFAAFGEPGPAIARWLAGGGWTWGTVAEWDHQSTPWAAAIGQRPVDPIVARRMGRGAVYPASRIRDFVGQSGIACLVGQPGRCRALIFGSPAISRDSAWRTAVVSNGGTTPAALFALRGSAPLGPITGRVLSEMVRTLGPDRFERFWTSPLPPADAFKTAAGIDVDDWLRDWAQHNYGATVTGPSQPSSGVLFGAAAIVSGLALAGFIVQRRQVG